MSSRGSTHRRRRDLGTFVLEAGCAIAVRAARRGSGADLGEVEQTLGVRLRVAHPSTQLRQARAHEHDRQLALRGPMQRGDEGGQLILLHVLQLVDEEGQCRAGRLGCLPHLSSKRLQVVLQVAVVGQARLGVEVEADLDVAIRDLQVLGESREGSQARR